MISVSENSVPHHVLRCGRHNDSGSANNGATATAAKADASGGGGAVPPKVRISLGILTHNNIEVVKKINRACLPTSYGERFYASIIANRELCRLAYIQDIPIGAICCKLFFDEQLPSAKDQSYEESIGLHTIIKSQQWELSAPTTPVVPKGKAGAAGKPAKFGILTLAVLEPYRRMGAGSMLMNWATERCEELRRGQVSVLTGPIPGATSGVPVEISEIFLHAWAANDEAINFYTSIGFVACETLKSYYSYLDPPDCVILRKILPSSADL